MKTKIENYLLESLRTKKELISFMGLSEGGFYSKLKKDNWKMREIEKMASFFNISPEDLLTDKGENIESTPKSDQYLQDYLMKIENEWKSIVAEKDNIIAEYKDIIKDLKQSRAAGQSNFLKPAPKTYWLDSKRIKRLQVAGAVAGVRA